MDRHFHFVHLKTGSALRASYALRFQVYCLERGILPADAYHHGLESDEFDHRSLHFGAFHNHDASLAGTVRLVRGALPQLPLAGRCVIDRHALPRDVYSSPVAEISRLAVSRQFRRRVTDRFLPGVVDPPARPRNEARRLGAPELVLGLYKLMYQETKRQGIEFWFAAMEPSLARVLKRMCFTFHPVGPEVDYHGRVSPYVARIRDIDAEIFAQCPELLLDLADGLEPELRPAQLRPGGGPPAPDAQPVRTPPIAAAGGAGAGAGDTGTPATVG